MKASAHPFDEYKTDTRPFIPGRGWGPGFYTCTCCRCKEGFLGEKRANECADCAYREQQQAELQEQQELQRILDSWSSGSGLIPYA